MHDKVCNFDTAVDQITPAIGVDGTLGIYFVFFASVFLSLIAFFALKLFRVKSKDKDRDLTQMDPQINVQDVVKDDKVEIIFAKSEGQVVDHEDQIEPERKLTLKTAKVRHLKKKPFKNKRSKDDILDEHSCWIFDIDKLF